MIAKKEIKRGTVIIKEKPLFIASKFSEVFPKYNKLSLKKQKIYNSLSHHFIINNNYNNDSNKESLVKSIFETNSIKLPDKYGNENDRGIFSIISRINHECLPKLFMVLGL